MTPIRVLNVVGLMSPGGIETLIMNIYRNIDREKVQFDFLTHKGIDGTFDEEIKALGGRIYKMPKLRDGGKTYYWKFFEYRKALKAFFSEHKEYHILHCHMTNTMAIYVPIAKKYGAIECVIAHSHLTQARPGLSGKITNILHKSVPKLATDYFACSEMAAHWIFSDSDIKSGKVKIIKNGIDPSRFNYDEDERNRIRREMGIEGKYVIGNVARFKKEKNQVFAVEVLKEVIKREKSAVLLLVGDGELRESVKQKVHNDGLDNHVFFLGIRNDIPQLMLAMDLFILPSLYEGLPVVGVEAQAAGLPVLTTTGVTKETDITGNVSFMDLNEGVVKWADRIISIRDSFIRHDMYGYIKKNGYDITETANWLQEFYIFRNNNN